MRIYVDGVMAVNFLVDFLLLLGTNRLAGFPSDMKRLLAAAGLGAVYSGICLLPQFRFLGNLLWRMVCLGLMGSMAFGWNREAVRRCGIFLLVSMALGGLAVSIGRMDGRLLIPAAAGLWLLCRLAFASSGGGQTYVPLEITRGDRYVKLLALRDTGNLLRDPISGQPAMVIAPWAACQLTGLTRRQLANPLDTLADHPIPGLRLIPYHTVGSTGVMLAMIFEDVTINGHRQKTLVAFAPEDFDRGAAYQALTGGIAGC